MHIVKNDGDFPSAEMDAFEADRHARRMAEIMLDIDDLDARACPPDRRYFLYDKEAWIYERGNICELIYVRVDCD